MKKYILLFLLFMLPSLMAERTVFFDYEIKKFGLKDGKKLLVKAEYYHILPPQGKLTLAQKANSIDVLDINGKKVLEISSIEHQLGLKIVCRTTSGNLTLVDLQSGVVFKNSYTDLSFVNNNYFSTGDKLIDLQEKMVLEGFAEYEVKRHLEDEIFICKSKTGIVLYDQSFSLLLAEYSPLTACESIAGNSHLIVTFGPSALKGIIDVKGKVLLEPKFQEIIISKNIYVYKSVLSDNVTYGVKTLDGVEILPPSTEINGVSSKWNGLIVLSEDFGDFIVSTKGVLLRPGSRIDDIKDYELGFLRGSKGSIKFVMNKTGKVIIRRDYNSFRLVGNLIYAEGPQSNDLFTRAGKVIITDIDSCKTFKNGYLITKAKKQGLISWDQKTIIKPQYSKIAAIQGLASDKYLALQKQGQWGVYDMNQKKMILPFIFTGVSSFGKSSFALQMSDSSAVTDLKGRILVKPSSFSIEDIQGDFAVIRFNDKWGVIDSKGKLIIAPQLEVGSYNDLKYLMRFIIDWRLKGFFISSKSLEDAFAHIQRHLFNGAYLEGFQTEFGDATALVKKNGTKVDLGLGEFFFLAKNFFSVGAKLFNSEFKDLGNYDSIFRLSENSIVAIKKNESFFINEALSKKGPYQGIFRDKKTGTLYFGHMNKRGVLDHNGEVLIPANYNSIIFSYGRYLCQNTIKGFSLADIYNEKGELLAHNLMGEIDLLEGGYYLQSTAASFYLYKDRERITQLPSCSALGGRVTISQGGDFKLPKALLPGALFDDGDLEPCDPCWPIKKFPAKIRTPSFIRK